MDVTFASELGHDPEDECILLWWRDEWLEKGGKSGGKGKLVPGPARISRNYTFAMTSGFRYQLQAITITNPSLFDAEAHSPSNRFANSFSLNSELFFFRLFTSLRVSGSSHSPFSDWPI
jgi:hypothetical protein